MPVSEAVRPLPLGLPPELAHAAASMLRTARPATALSLDRCELIMCPFSSWLLGRPAPAQIEEADKRALDPAGEDDHHDDQHDAVGQDWHARAVRLGHAVAGCEVRQERWHDDRSEERRVGKECKTRRQTEH